MKSKLQVYVENRIAASKRRWRLASAVAGSPVQEPNPSAGSLATTHWTVKEDASNNLGFYDGVTEEAYLDSTGDLQINGWQWQAGRNYVTSASYANPATTTSTALVSMGLGSTYALTPKFSGKVRIIWRFFFQNTVANVGGSAQPEHGTGAAPVNGGATGTLDIALQGYGSNAGNGQTDVFIYEISGLSVGTAYWFDIALETANMADGAKITNVIGIIEEI
jgi:hypothetical protein